METEIAEQIQLLSHSDPHVRRDAARALGEAAAREAIPALCELLAPPASGLDEESNSEHTARAAAAVALGRIGDPSATDALIAAIADPFNAGTAASTALGRLSPPPIERLIEATRDANAWRRARAVVALGEAGASSAFDAVVALLDDPEASVRRAAASGLERLRDPRAVEPLVGVLAREDEASLVRSYAAVALGAIKDRSSVEPLMRVLDSPEPLLRRSAARALCRIDDPRSRARLEAMTIDDPDATVRQIVDRYISPRPGQRQH